MKKLWLKIRSVDTSYRSLDSLGFLSLLIILASLVYYSYKITPFVSFVLVFLIVIPIILFKPQWKIPKEKIQPISIAILLLDIFLLGQLFLHRTFDLAASPWTEIDPSFFLVYTLATALLFLNYKKNTSKIQNVFLTSLHFFVGLSVAAIIYPLGYGFDAFIHRVTENWIQVHGFISPKQPYYIGQYSLVVLLSNITQIKIFFIDVWLVPALAAIFLPKTIFKSLEKTIDSEFLRYISFWILAFVPFLLLSLTTPHNLVLFFTIVLIFLNFSQIQNPKSLLPSFLISLAALFTHPLIGAPIFIFTLSIFLIQKFQTKKKFVLSILALTFVGLCLLLPAMFTLNGLRVGGKIPTFGNPFTHISSFLELFKDPYWYAKSSPLRFEILYFFEKIIIPIVLLLALFGFVQYRKKEKSLLVWIFPLSALALFIDAWLLRSWIVFPDVVAYEQGDYPLRLIRSSIIFLLPFAMYGFASLYEIIKNKKQLKNIFVFCIIPLALALALYLSYPQRNIKARFPGYNVTQSDFKAVEWIHQQNSEYNYIVLSNQLVSAAALTDYSFAKYFDTPLGQMFYYSIPTGGELYKYYGKMIYEGQKQEYMNEAMNVVGVKKSYFVVNSYWANSGKIIEQAKQTADSYEVFDEGKVWVFAYTKK